METSNSPFTKEMLLPQEERLEVNQKRGELFIGIPKETHSHERRICLTPDAVGALTANGHRVMVESKAGKGARYTDKEYSENGAEITLDTAKVFSCPMILKVEPPSLEEIQMMNPQTVVISALQLKTQKKIYFEKLASKRVTALAFEFIKDKDGTYPAVRTLSEIAGTAAVQVAAEIMSNSETGTGMLLGNISGVPPAEIVIIGAGTVGEFAARSAIGLGANVKIFDNSITKLRCIQTNVGRPLYTSTIQPKNLVKALKRCDAVIGAVRGSNRSPVIVSERMVEAMKNGAVIIDVSIDMGGCFETSEVTTHAQPTYKKHGVTHYCVPNIPARFARTASVSLSNIFTPYLIEIAEQGGIENKVRFDQGLKNGLYLYRGILTKKAVADWFDLSYRDINLLIF